MTAAVVGSGKVELTGDLAAFATSAEADLRKLFDTMGVTVDEESGKLSTEFAKIGETAGTSFGVGAGEGIKAGTPATTAAAVTSASEVGEASEARFGELGLKAGEKFGEGARESIKGLATSVLPLVGALGAGELVKGIVEQADQLEGANEKIEGVFGKSADTVESWAKNVAGSLRISTSQAETSAGTFGQFFHQLGVNQSTAAGMSDTFVSLTQNMAKFNNADPAAVQAALTSALRGRATAMKQYGVALDNTTINQEALKHSTELGNIVMKDGQPVLTASQKGLATYYAILDQTKNQQDALGKSTNTLAQQKALLKAQVDNVEAAMGTKLLPTLTKVAIFFTAVLLPAIEKGGEWLITKLKQPVADVSSFIGKAFGDAREAILFFFDGFQSDQALIGGVSGWRQQFYTFGMDVKNILKALIPVIEGLIGEFVKMGQFIVSDVLPKILPLAEWFISNLLPALDDVAQFIAGKVIPALEAIGNWMSHNGPTVLTFVGVILAAVVAFKAWTIAVELWRGAVELATAIQVAFDAAMDANPIGLIVLAIAALAAGVVYAYTHFATFRDVIKEAWQIIQDVISVAWNDVIMPVFNAIVTVVDFVAAHWKAFAIGIGIAVGLILLPFALMIAAVVEIGLHWRQILDAMQTAWHNTWNAILAAWNTVGVPIFNVIKIIVTIFVDFFKVQFLIVVVAMQLMWDALMLAWHGIGQPIFNLIVDAVKLWWSLVKVQFDLVVAGFKLLWTLAVAAWNAVGKPLLHLIEVGVQDWWSFIKIQFNLAVAGFKLLWAAVQVVWNNTGRPLFAGIETASKGLGAGLTWAYNNVIKPVGDKIAAVWTGISTGFSNLWSGIADVGSSLEGPIKAVFNGVIDVINDVIGALNHISVKIPSWSPIDGGKTFGVHLDTIPNIAEGATILPTSGGTVVRVAEAGKAETIVDTGEMNRLMANVNARGGDGSSAPDWDTMLDLLQTIAEKDPVLKIDSREVAQVVNNANTRQNVRGR